MPGLGSCRRTWRGVTPREPHSDPMAQLPPSGPRPPRPHPVANRPLRLPAAPAEPGPHLQEQVLGGGPSRAQRLLWPRSAGVDHTGARRLVGPGWADRPVPVEHVAPVDPYQRCKGKVSPGSGNRPVPPPAPLPPQPQPQPPRLYPRRPARRLPLRALRYPGGCGSGGLRGCVWRPRGSRSRSSTQRRHLSGRKGGRWARVGGYLRDELRIK